MKKIRVCTYTDESGQDTKGDLFVVCTIITLSENSDVLEKELVKIETESNKRNKWYKTNDKNRQSYIKNLIKSKLLNKLHVYFSIYHYKNPDRKIVGVCENGRSPKCVETPTVRSWVLHKNKLDYSNLLGSHIAESIINSVGDKEYKAKIFIDKTNNAVINEIKNEIKLYKIRYQKIRGLSDNSSSLIRLADSSCGLIRDLNKNKQADCYKVLFRKFKEV